ncbi:pyridoxal-phosphate dependent enzyme [Streptomyces sp. WAC01526]|uniref:pyridoxal-phosphate dependent enzyme n=1 Tax=Streptomyces sp. WAC01526 TaxID=2588709 RepID=UPI0021CD06D9|nr:pyridoxal-phosphate dependent enzyme [Streptomyces sp. WAC01526]
MAVGVAAAVAAGADTVVAASSGNAGAAAAAYAARAGLRCLVFTNEAVPAGLRAQIDALDAERVARPGTTAERNAAMARAVEQPGRYPLTSYSSPSPGGNPPPSSQLRSSRGGIPMPTRGTSRSPTSWRGTSPGGSSTRWWCPPAGRICWPESAAASGSWRPPG